MNGVHSAVQFLEMSNSTLLENSAYKIEVTGTGSGVFNRDLMRTFP